jgi:hypothetical protein
MTVKRSDYSLVKQFKVLKLEDGTLQEVFSGYLVYDPEGNPLGFAVDLVGADGIITLDMEERELVQKSILAPGS